MSSSTAARSNHLGDFAALVFALVSILLVIGVAVWAWSTAPEPLPDHFDASGRPDSWSSKAETLGVLVPIGVGIPVIFSIRWIWEKLPSAIINVPFKDYWLGRGGREYLYDCLMQFMRIVGGLVALLLAWMLVMIVREAQGSPMPSGMQFVPTAIFLALNALAVWLLVHRLRPPR